MKKRWAGYAIWLLLTASLYFFENNAGTRTVLICSAMFPMIPLLRAAIFSADEPETEAALRPLTVKSFVSREAEEPGDIRPYAPGDPIRRIHWKLSAKKDELLIRETVKEQEPAEEERLGASAPDSEQQKQRIRYLRWLPVGMIALSGVLLLLIPEARAGLQALSNRIFAASEKINAYAYDYFPTPAHQSVVLAVILLAAMGFSLMILILRSRSRMLTMGIMALCTLFQVYFGLAFPDWVNILLYGGAALWMMRRPMRRREIMAFACAVLCVFLLVTIFFPGVDQATETASENVRDWLSQAAQQITGSAQELPEGETETRHVHTQSLRTGEDHARAGREFRLVTVEEEQISMPHWVNWLKIILLLILAVALVVLPFGPFLLLNTRKKRAQEDREFFSSENVSEAVCAIFQRVISWLRETGHDGGNLLYREWEESLRNTLSEEYALRFARCAEDYEEAAYSSHVLPEEKRQQALKLLTETEDLLWKTTDWKQRLRIRYWMCLHE